MMDVGRHPRIRLLTNSEVEEVSGFVGNFRVKVRKKTRYIDEDACTACGDCVAVCPIVKPDEHSLGLGVRRAIYIPFPQAVPAAYIISREDCLGNNPIACGKCLEACEKKCIDYDMQDEIVEFEVGAVVVATGMDVYDPTELDEFGYTRFPNVVTSMEFEIITSPSGPTGGKLIRFSDKQKPTRIGFVQCIGSRSERSGNRYCSNICCMNTVKDTLYLADHYPDVESKVFYIDMRAFGKGFEDLYRRSRERGVQYIRGIPGSIREDSETGTIFLTVEDTTTGEIGEHEVDMLVLAVGVEPRRDAEAISKLLTLSTTSDGFYLESHPKLKPVDSPTDGVFLAGCAEYPKDVKDSVTQASAAAARAEGILSQDKIRIEAITGSVLEELCKDCGICAGVCPYNAITVEKKSGIPAILTEALCKGCGTCAAECPFGAIDMKHFSDAELFSQVDAMLAENPEDKVLVFACNWCSYAGADFAGLSRLEYPASGRLIRTMCSGRVDEKFILRGFELGAPVVLVSGCHFADCHYIDANRWTVKRVEKLWNKLERFKIRPERLQLEWCSAAESARWVTIMNAAEDLRKQVTAEEREETMQTLKADRERREKRKARR